ncbi:MAG: hypothetical protein WBQ57_02070, partial [Rhodanobacteraceae bacterium]
AALGGAASGAVQTGTFRGAVIGAFSAELGYGIGQAFGEGNFQSVLANATAGGVTQELNGGNFGHGFFAAGLTSYIAPQIHTGNGFEDGVSFALVGGTASVISGGKFANGAVTGAFQYAFGRVAERGASPSPSGDMSGGFSGDLYYLPNYGAQVVPIAFEGPVTPQFAAEIFSAASDFYGSVGTPIQFQEVPTGMSNSLSVRLATGAPFLKPSLMGSYTDFFKGSGGITINDIRLNMSTPSPGYAFSHELGHVFGLVDRYNRSTLVPKSGFTNNLMGAYGGTTLNQNQINTINANISGGWQPTVSTTDGQF